MKRYHYDQLTNELHEETIYDPTAVIEANKAIKNAGERVMFGSKGQQMLKVASVDMDHIVALRNMGYDLLSPDPAEVKRALLYVQSMETDWMCVDGKPIAERKQVWL
jgi:hypothetical protein